MADQGMPYRTSRVMREDTRACSHPAFRNIPSAAGLKPSRSLAVWRGMTDDPTSSLSLPPQDLARLRERAAAAIARTQELDRVWRAAQAQAASLCVESAILVDEVRFRQMALR
jgi:hypothetical protein